MATPDAKYVVTRYLDAAHDAVRWKLDGLSEYELRRPLTPTGTNLLGVTKHLAIIEAEYLGSVFGRPLVVAITIDHDVPNADMYATADESVDDVLAMFDAVREHAFDTLEALDLDAEGHVPWWGDANPVTLHQIAVHLIAEFNRHLGQFDILREGLDGAVGHREGADNLPDVETDYWPTYVTMLESIASRNPGTS